MLVCYLALVMSQIILQNESLNVELAITEQERSTGLMHHTSLLEGQGMLFIYLEPTTLCFAMKTTQIPLSIGFFDANRRLLQIEDMPVANGKKQSRYLSKRPAQYALEVPLGYFERHHIEPGALFEWFKIVP